MMMRYEPHTFIAPNTLMKIQVIGIIGIIPCLCFCVLYPSVWPVKLFKNILEVLHGAVCDQHDGLVTQAALPQGSSLNTHTQANTIYSVLTFGTEEIN